MFLRNIQEANRSNSFQASTDHWHVIRLIQANTYKMINQVEVPMFLEEALPEISEQLKKNSVKVHTA